MDRKWLLLWSCAALACSGEGPKDGTETGTEPGIALDYRDSSPSEPGPFQAGYAVASVTYTPSSDDGDRTIPVHVWYPTDDMEGETVHHEGIFEDEEALGGATAAASMHAGGWPVLVHSHGHQGYAGNSAFLHAHLASHGFVVVVPDHVDNTLTDNVEPRSTAHYIHRPEDLSAALDAVGADLFADVGLVGVDVSRVVAAGHSYGVYTVWAIAGAMFDEAQLDVACADGGSLETGCTEAERAAFRAGLGDDRVVATVPMAGSIRRSLHGDTGHQSVTTPMLSLSGSEDPVGADTQFESSPEVPLTWMDIDGACHQTFGIGTCGTLDVDTGFVLVETLVLSFARYHLLADTSPEVVGVVEGTALDPLVTYQSYVFP